MKTRVGERARAILNFDKSSAFVVDVQTDTQITIPGRPGNTARPDDSTGLNPVTKAPKVRVKPVDGVAGEAHANCAKCKLFESAQSPFWVDGVHWVDGKPVEGLPRHQPDGGWVVIVGESLDAEADRDNTITDSQPVKALSNLLKSNFPEMLDRVWFTLATGCRPNNPADSHGKIKGASDKQIGYCGGFMMANIDKLQPIAVIPLGAAACQAVVGRKDVMNMSGRVYEMEVAAATPQTTVGHVNDRYDVYIGRTCTPDQGSVTFEDAGWGNPFVIGRDGDRHEVVVKHRQWLPRQASLLSRLHELKGKRLGCWCKTKNHPEQECHGDALAELADALPSQERRVIQVYPLWAIGYAKDEEWQWKQYLEKWRRTISFINNIGKVGIRKNFIHFSEVQYVVATKCQTVEDWFTPIMDDLDGPLCWDTETTDVKPWRKNFKTFLFSFAHRAQPKVLLIPLDYQHYPDAFNKSGDVASRTSRAKMLALLKLVMESPKIWKLSHNGKFDQNGVKAYLGWDVKGFLADTQLLEYCIDPNTLGFRGLDDIVRAYMPEYGEYWKAVEQYKLQHPVTVELNYEHFPLDIMLPYAASDTAVLPYMFQIMQDRLIAMGKARHGGWFVRAGVERPATPTYSVHEYAMLARRIHHLMACEIEQNGLSVDHDLIDQMHAYYTSVHDDVTHKLLLNEKVKEFEQQHLLEHMADSPRKEWIRKTAYEIIPDLKPRTPLKKFKDAVLASDRRPTINWGSAPQQIGFFVNFLGMPVIKKTETGGICTDADVIGSWAYGHDCEPAKLLLEYRECTKFIDAYLNPMRSHDEDRILHDDGKIHSDFKVAGPVTGRLATCVDRNTLINTMRGLTPIHTLCEGDMVRTHTGLYRRCLGVFVKGVATQYAVTTRSGQQIVCTADHRFLASTAESTKPTWVKLRDIRFGYKVATATDYHVALKEVSNHQFDTTVIMGDARGSCQLMKFEEVATVTNVGDREVWDCTIEFDESYEGNAYISHNSGPNVQALPRTGLVKRLYNSRFKDGWILQRDYSGLEVRVLALFSREPALLEAFRKKGDPHFKTQQHFFNNVADKKNKTQRSVCKRCLFGRIYGQGDQGLMELLRKERVMSPTTGEPITLEECSNFNKMIDNLYPQVCDWVQLAHAQAVQKCFTCSAFGFTVPLAAMTHYDRWKRDKKKGIRDAETSRRIGAALRYSQNYCIQSTASDITTFAAYQIIRMLKSRKLRALLVLVVHDAIYVDCPPEEVTEVSAIMHDVMDNLPDWIDQVLPGYDPSWIDIPIVGEGEIGINAIDAFGCAEEPTLLNYTDDTQLLLNVPKYPEDDARSEQIKRMFGDAKTINWKDGKAEIVDFLTSQRFVFQ
jgi:DNA polymerase I-like protein with 3'-5' exonuclease and polymerase domains/uracil-DNA glycosylase